MKETPEERVARETKILNEEILKLEILSIEHKEKHTEYHVKYEDKTKTFYVSPVDALTRYSNESIKKLILMHMDPNPIEGFII